jgi:23S rRNA (cytosine1962-C5)-methyltransferase
MSLILNHKFEGFYNRLQKVFKLRSKLAHKKGITCYRLYDRDMPEHPVIIDVYEQHAVMYEYKSKHKLTDEEYDAWWQQIVDIVADVLQFPKENVHLKMRKRIIEREEQYQKQETSAQTFIVHEGGLNFETNYENYLDTGLFLDHRITRGMVQEQCAGKKVLNLFCYTGSFSIYAAAGKAKEVWSADLSNTYIDWGKRNEALNKNKIDVPIKWMKCDVLQELNYLPLDYYDIIISDPPTFSNSKMMKAHWDVVAHHVEHLTKLKSLLKSDGIIYFSNNAQGFELDAAVSNLFTIKDITKATTDFDFEGKLQRKCYHFGQL